MTPDPVTARGRCLCGGVRYEVHGALRPVVYCHCSQCRRSSGHFVAATACAADDLVIDTSATLRWHASSPNAERGFCGECGGNLFWRPASGTHVSVMTGSLDVPTGVAAVAHIFVDDKSDYHAIVDGLPQYAGRGPKSLDE